MLLRMTLSLLPIIKLQTPGLDLAVNKGANKPGNDLGPSVLVDLD